MEIISTEKKARYDVPLHMHLLRHPLTLLMLLLWSNSSALYSQKSILTVEYCVALTEYDSLNYIVNRYNDTRPWLDAEMETFTWLKGPDIATGAIGKAFIFEVGYGWRGQKRMAEGNGAIRQLKISANVARTSIALRIHPASEKISLCPGISIDAGRFTARTRTWDEGENKPKWEKPVREFNLYGTAFVRLLLGRQKGGGAALSITPYYTYGLFTPNLAPLNEVINPATYMADPQQIGQQTGHFGLKAGFCFLM